MLLQAAMLSRAHPGNFQMQERIETNTPPPTSANPGTPLRLDIRRGTPVVDMRSEIVGSVWGVTHGLCVVRTDQHHFFIAPWQDVALGNIRPAASCLPQSVAEQDQLDYYAQALCNLNHARGVADQQPPPALETAHQFLVRTLKAKP